MLTTYIIESFAHITRVYRTGVEWWRRAVCVASYGRATRAVVTRSVSHIYDVCVLVAG